MGNFMNRLYLKSTKTEYTNPSFEIIKIVDPDKCSNKNCIGNRCTVDQEKKEFCFTHYSEYVKQLKEES